MRTSLKPFFTTLLLGSLLLVVPLALAQDAAPAADSNAAIPGIATLVFLLGAFAIIVVGGATLLRDTYRSDDDQNS